MATEWIESRIVGAVHAAAKICRTGSCLDSAPATCTFLNTAGSQFFDTGQI
jgi:hypothetical protein